MDVRGRSGADLGEGALSRRSVFLAQFGWYLPVGGTAFIADVTVFAALIGLGMSALLAASISFLLGTAVNYAMSRALAFRAGRFRAAEEFSRLFCVAAVGLVLTLVLMWAFAELTPLPALAIRIIVVPLVLVWNFLGRRLFVFRASLPMRTERLTIASVDKMRRVSSLKRRPSEARR